MKRYATYILVVLPYIICGCSTSNTSSVAKYADIPPTSTNRIKTTPEMEALHKYQRDFEQTCAAADLVLETEDWRLFKETKPVHVSVDREALGELLRNKRLVGHGVAVVAYQGRYTGGVEALAETQSEVRLALKDAGFVRIDFLEIPFVLE